jgi:hypothetical protein
VIEHCTPDVMGQNSWRHHLNVEDHPAGGAAKVLWMVLTSGGFNVLPATPNMGV